jgi:two-component system, sensor histidine kinase and response regulator
MELPIFDVQDAMERVEGDRELLAELVALFLEDYLSQLDKLHQAIRENHSQQVERLAHSLKSALANLSAKRAANTACQLETLGRAGNLEAALDAICHLQDELRTLTQVMEHFLQTPPT